MIPNATANALLERRNKAVGWLLTSERAVAYVGILIVLLRFRQNHELEPLHEDVLAALDEGEEAAPFNQDIRQLQDWGLVSQRIEKERLRGYRDTRRRKFRYRMEDDAVSFLLWLEARHHDDLHPEDTDTRDLLADVIAGLRETTRLMNKLSADIASAEDARAVFHRLARLDAATEGVAESLGAFNIRLLAFAGGRYDVARARALIAELDRFLERFIRRVHTLRLEIVPEIEKLRHSRLRARWETCAKILAEETAATPTLMRARLPDAAKTLALFADFYAPNGRLEQLTSRVSRSALMVWQKLHAHLRELERRSHRLEDIRLRVRDLARLAPDAVPRPWLRGIFQDAHIRADMHEWTESMKAAPPQPVWHKRQVRGKTPAWLEPRAEAGGKPVQSLEERRLEALAAWMCDHGVMPADGADTRLSAATVAAFDDFARVMDILRGGVLGGGRRLARIGATADILPETATLSAADASLVFHDVTLRKVDTP